MTTSSSPMQQQEKNESKNLLAGKPNWLSTESYGLSLVLLSTFCYTTMGVFIQLAQDIETTTTTTTTTNHADDIVPTEVVSIPSTELVFFRAIFQGTLTIWVMLWQYENHYPTNNDTSPQQEQLRQRLIYVPLGRNIGITNSTISRQRIFVMLRGAVGGFGFILHVYTTSVLPLGDAITLLSLSPIVTVVATALIFKPHGTLLQLPILHGTSAIACVIGSILIANPNILNFGSSEDHDQSGHFIADTNDDNATTHPAWLGYITAISGACCSAGVLLMTRLAGKSGAHTLQLLFSWSVFATFFSLLIGVGIPTIISWYKDNSTSSSSLSWIWPSSNTNTPTRTLWFYIAGVCFFASAQQVLMNFAVRHCNPGLASVIRSTSIVWGYMVQIIFFHTIPSGTTCVGVLCIGSSLIMVAVQKFWDETNVNNNNKQHDQGNNEVPNDVISHDDDVDHDDEQPGSYSMEHSKLLIASSSTTTTTSSTSTSTGYGATN